MVETAGWIEITSATELSELLGAPTPRSANKDRVRLHERDREWLAASPFCLVATGPCRISRRKPLPAGI